jgi:branched-chain amino acid transport system permease protein
VEEDELAAAMVGVNVTAVKVQAFTAGGFVAGLSGALFVHYSTYIDHDMIALPLAVTSVTYPMLGGLGSFWGTILGAVFLISLTEGLRFLQEFRLIIYGALIILTMIFRPRGIIDEAAVLKLRALVRRKPAPSPGA